MGRPAAPGPAMSWRDAPLYVACHDLVVWTAQACGPDVVGLRVTDCACTLLESVSLALTFPAGRALHLRDADRAVVRTRVLLRVAADTGVLGPRRARFALGQLVDIGRMIGGWRKRVERSALSESQPRGGPPPASTG